MKIDKAEARETGIQLLKYGVIGVLNTLITLVTFYLLNTRLGLSYGISNVTGYILGVINSFLWNRNWVFKTKNNFKRELLLFVCGFLICLALQLCVNAEGWPKHRHGSRHGRLYPCKLRLQPLCHLPRRSQRYSWQVIIPFQGHFFD